uniref:Small ubiquitin like modifier 2b n=1 Tax=Dicentrarchus labrax TaxID=13489 RepID=A0A8C4DGT5_DICLA
MKYSVVFKLEHANDFLVDRLIDEPTNYSGSLHACVNCLFLSDFIPQEGVKTENNEHINLKVAGQDGSVVQFKIKRHTPLIKLMKAYCERQGLAMRQIRFRFDGQPINETDTPAQLEMEDEDTIDVFQQQTGGGKKPSGMWTV